jgi:SAM-dependent methyltransferase
MIEPVIYEGRDLEAMAFARNYHRWILKIFEPYLGMRLVEVGAGAGSFSELLLERSFESLALVEPSSNMYPLLKKHIETFQREDRITSFNALFREVAASIKAEQRPDSIIYINVMEHIADDIGELRAIYETLGEGGRVFIFVPALQWLYSAFDELVNHQRRYTKPELEDKCEAAGFRIIKSNYFDIAGIFPWLVKYRLLKSETMEPGAVELYDRLVVPLARIAENLIPPPTGKNVILIAEKT